jgi:hypothetical protein
VKNTWGLMGFVFFSAWLAWCIGIAFVFSHFVAKYW